MWTLITILIVYTIVGIYVQYQNKLENEEEIERQS